MSYVFMHGFPIFDPYYALEQDGSMTQEFEKIRDHALMGEGADAFYYTRYPLRAD
ncbi:hypothetical protein [Sulfobacillus thermotolerans]|uniref:hypothetical protein n=1 Tax=Sulfobacillus thermotolerans TaxID=338644 RepID=UPI003369A9E3